MSIGDPGLPDYCLTSVSQGALAYLAPGAKRNGDLDKTTGLIYRGLPGTRLSATDDHERMAIWIPASSLAERLAALLGGPEKDDIAFDPFIDWESGPGQGIRRLIWLLTQELASPNSFAANDMACRSFTDLLLYTLLRSQPNNYSMQLARPANVPVPRMIRRAEEYIQARAGQPIALHEVADAAGCSVRSLQLGFRQFRDTTPAARFAKLDLRLYKIFSVRPIRAHGHRGRLSIRLHQSRPFLGTLQEDVRRISGRRPTTQSLPPPGAALNAAVRFPELPAGLRPDSCAICPSIAQTDIARPDCGSARYIR